MAFNNPQNPAQVPEKMTATTDQLLYEALQALGGPVDDFYYFAPAPENIGMQQPPYSSNTQALLYELVLAMKASGNGGQAAANNLVLTTIAGLRANAAPLGNVLYYTTDAHKQGFWRYDATDNASADNGGTVVIGATAARFKRVYTGAVQVRWFGAVPDGITDCTAAVQAAVNFVLASGGGAIEYTSGQYLQNGTVYIFPAGGEQIPLTIKGPVSSHKGDGWGLQAASAQILRNVPGDIFRVNMDAAGNGVQVYPLQYCGFAIEGVSFVGRNDATGINAIKTFRTRGTYRNLFSAKLDYLLNQPATDAAGNDSYCDMNIIENVRISASLKGGMLLYKADATVINGYYFEGALATAKFGLEVYKTSGLVVNGLLHWSQEGQAATVAGGAFCVLNECFAATIKGAHIENSVFESAFYLENCGGLSITNIFSTYKNRDLFRISTVKGLTISDWYSYETKPAGTYDINFVSGANSNSDIVWRNVQVFDRSQIAGVLRRDLQINNLANRGILRHHIERETVSDLNTPTGTKFISSTANPGNLPGGGFFNGLQVMANDDQNFIYQFGFINGVLHRRVKSSGAWGSWVKLVDEAGTYANPSFITSLAGSKITTTVLASDPAQNFTPAAAAGAFYLCTFITANRTFTIPNLANGDRITIANLHSNTTHQWSLSQQIIYPNNVTATVLKPRSVVQLQKDTSGAWRVINEYISGGAGTSYLSGDGVTTEFTIAHPCGTIPGQVLLTPVTLIDGAYWISSKTATEFKIKFAVAPAVGDYNIGFDWIAK